VARPGTIAGDLVRRAGDFVARRRSSTSSSAPAAAKKGSPASEHIELARRHGKLGDATVRQDLVRLHILGEIGRLSTERHKAVRAAGGDIPGIANFSKLVMADVVRLKRDLGLRIIGPLGTLHGYTADERRSLADALDGGDEPAITAQALGAQALPIYGGTDQVQRNVIGERTLGLPKEPGDLKNVPFSQMPKNG
jgi:alkylation response protein AidB-like acyl-CoA dehydrogenase